MPRYLTPAKLTLLVLIDLYMLGGIGADARLAVLSVLPKSIINNNADKSSVRIEEFARQLSQHPYGETSLSIYDALLHRLSEFQNLDALFVFFAHLTELIAPTIANFENEDLTKVSRASPLGQFIRRCCYEFERLQFADVQKLWNSFASYRAASTDRSSGEGDERFDPESTSTHDIDDLLNSSIQELQKIGSRVPQMIKTKLQQWFEAQHDSNTQSLRYFLAFFEHWKAGQMSMALESLHQYFDYSVGAHRGAENLKVYFQYAQLHQSVLYADFGCWEESANAMSECIAAARENQDTACLNFALSWLLHLRQVYPSDQGAFFDGLVELLGGSTENDEIAFLKTKARDSKLRSLMSGTLLEEAKLELYSGGNTSQGLEHILQAMYIHIQHDQRSLMPSATFFESATLERLGQSKLAHRICESILPLHNAYAPLGDKVRAVGRSAYVLAQMGQYDLAEKTLATVAEDVKGVVKSQDRLRICKIMVELRRLIHEDRQRATRELLQSIRATQSTPEIDFEATMMETAHLIQAKKFEEALSVVNKSLWKMKGTRTTDIAQRLQLLVLKSRIFAAAGQPTKGFSIVMRAAITAERHQLVSVLTEALSVLSMILIALEEFEAAQGLVEATLPHALSGNNASLEAELLSSLADTYVALSANFPDGSEEQLRQVVVATKCIDRSHAAYARLVDVPGTLMCLVKKAALQRAMGDEAAADETDTLYEHFWEEHHHSMSR